MTDFSDVINFSSYSIPKTQLNIEKGENFNFTQEYHYYIGHRGDNSDFDSRASGAYIFRPTEEIPNPVFSTEIPTVQDGPLFYELLFKYGYSNR